MGINSGTEPWAFSHHSLISSLLNSVLGHSIHTPQRGIVQDVWTRARQCQLASGPKTLSISYGIDTARHLGGDSCCVQNPKQPHHSTKSPGAIVMKIISTIPARFHAISFPSSQANRTAIINSKAFTFCYLPALTSVS